MALLRLRVSGWLKIDCAELEVIDAGVIRR